MNTTTENNKLIADFIGLKSTNKCVRSETGKYFDYHSHPKFTCIKEQEIQIESKNGFGLVEQDFLFIEDLKFHSDWHWLMQVVEKIESLGYWVEILGGKHNVCQIGITNNIKSFIALDNKSKIEAVHNACIEFINWYNINK